MDHGHRPLTPAPEAAPAFELLAGDPRGALVGTGGPEGEAGLLQGAASGGRSDWGVRRFLEGHEE